MWYREILAQTNQKGDIYHEPLDIPMSPTLMRILNDLKGLGKRAWMVGGCVRDAIQGQKPKDIDIEVYNSTMQELADVLSQYGRIDLVGKSFGVIKFTDPEGNDYDFSVTRRDNKTGVGHDDFEVVFDPTITPKEAASRRDFTFNSMAYDPLNQEVHDYYHGREDLENKILRPTSPAFAEDPLRVLRGMQFTARMGLTLAPEMGAICRNMMTDYEQSRPSLMADYVNGGREKAIARYQAKRNKLVAEYVAEHPEAQSKDLLKKFPDQTDKKFPLDPEQAFPKRLYDTLAKERVAEEWMKLAVKGKYPGSAIKYLKDTGWIVHHPEIENMVGVPQDPEWHPEGDVDIHVAHVMDAAAAVADRKGLKGDDRAAAVFAALGHDFAKSLPEKGGTTMLREKDGRQRWTAHGHEEASGPLIEQFMKSIGIKDDIIKRVRPIVERHLEHIRYKPGTTSPKSVRQLAHAIHPGTIEELANLMEADSSGRPPLPKGIPEQAQYMLDMARHDGSANGRPVPIIKGRDIMPYYNGVGGPHIGQIADAAYKAQLNGAINTPEDAATWLKGHLRDKISLVKGTDVLPYYGNKGGPHVGTALNAAWDAQLNNEFNDNDLAKQWLDNYMSSQELPKEV